MKIKIPQNVRDQYPDLTELILKTPSMEDVERQYWFEIFPKMSINQINRLFDILETERIKIEDLETKYQKKIKALNEKHLRKYNNAHVIYS